MAQGYVLEQIEIGFTQGDEQSLNLNDVHGHVDQKETVKDSLMGLFTMS